MKKHKFSINSYVAVLILTLSLLFTSCDPDDDIDPSRTEVFNLVTVMNGFEQGGKFSTTFRVLVNLNLVPTYNGSGAEYDYTIFAPNNTAWDNFLAQYDGWGSVSDVPNSLLREIMTYHVVAGTVTSSGLGSSQTTEQGEDISISGTTLNGSSNVVTADITATNGVIHEIDAVLAPSTVPVSTIAEIAIGGSDFSSLVAAVSRFPDLLDAIDGGNGVFTVFAPTNAAFSSALSTLGFASLDDIPDPLLRTILEYHVLSSQFLAADLSGEVTTLGGEAITVNLDAVSTADVLARNGAVHIVNEVLVPPSLGTLVGEVLTNSDFSILAAAIVEADLVPALAGEGPLTVFAPNDDAFANAGITDLNAIAIEDLTKILTYHVIEEELASGDIVDAFKQTLNGNYLSLTTDGGVDVDNANVTGVDLTFSNGIVHVIDNVIMPASETIVDIAINNAPTFDTLVAALTKADLVSTLQGEGTFTVFAPTNDAFIALFSELGVSGLADLSAEQLRPILLHHVVATGQVFSTNLPNSEVETASGNSIIINADEAKVITSSAQEVDLTAVGILNLRGNNGVVHVVDKVFLP